MTQITDTEKWLWLLIVLDVSAETASFQCSYWLCRVSEQQINMSTTSKTFASVCLWNVSVCCYCGLINWIHKSSIDVVPSCWFVHILATWTMKHSSVSRNLSSSRFSVCDELIPWKVTDTCQPLLMRCLFSLSAWELFVFCYIVTGQVIFSPVFRWKINLPHSHLTNRNYYLNKHPLFNNHFCFIQ